MKPPSEAGEDRGELVGLLRRLSLTTLEDFTGLAEREVAGRFPRDAIIAHRLEAGRLKVAILARRGRPSLPAARTWSKWSIRWFYRMTGT